ncbi:CLUMA_CG020627, isoform A [Clunio marinus]|nr:CLUMA_CG020627, isoform A [Clunio marinus]
MHDQMKAKFLEENEEEWKKDFIEKISVPGYKFLPEMTQQRFVKTHLPFKLLPPSIMEKRAKVVYVARHPKDVVVSYYHLNKLYRTQGYVNDFNTFFEYFTKDLLHWSPYFEHIKDAWSHRHDENVLFLFYEDLIKDLESSLKQLACFLGKPLKEEHLPKLLDHLSIQNFKNNPALNGKDLIDVKVLATGAQGFVRLGSTEKNSELTSEMSQKIEKWIEANLKDSDFKFRV